jgi:hypothetical protein
MCILKDINIRQAIIQELSFVCRNDYNYTCWSNYRSNFIFISSNNFPRVCFVFHIKLLVWIGIIFSVKFRGAWFILLGNRFKTFHVIFLEIIRKFSGDYSKFIWRNYYYYYSKFMLPRYSNSSDPRIPVKRKINQWNN